MKKEKMNITRKIEIVPDIEGKTHEESNKICYDFIRSIDRSLYMTANHLVSQLYGLDNLLSLLRLQNEEYVSCLKDLKKNPSEEKKGSIKQRMEEIDKELLSIKKDIAPINTKTFAYRAIKDTPAAEGIPTDILNTLKQDVFNHYNSSKKEQQQGKRTLTTYKKGMPIPFSIVVKENGKEKIRLVLIGEDYFLRWYNDTRFKLNFGRDRSNNRAIVDNCIKSGKYKLCTAAKIQIKERKLFLLITVDIPDSEREPIKGKVMGIDLGVKNPAYVAVNNGPERSRIGNGDAFQKQRDTFRRRFRELQRSQLAQSGHGRKHKTKATEALRGKERNWVQTENHRLSREIVNLAIRWKVETIQMEDLKGFGRTSEGNVEKTHKRLLGRWSYYELQKDIEYKAKMAGIKVKYIEPAYTSQTCHVCGQRGDRSVRDIFVCTNPDCECYNQPQHADMNAAINIAKSKNIKK